MSALAPVERSYVRTSAGELHLRRCGDRGPLLLLLQVLPFGGMLFDPLLPLLAAAGLRCVAPDLMGYGRSDRRPGLWRVEDFADNIDEAAARLDLVPDVILGGHFAAMVAAALTWRGRAAPRALVLDGAPVWPLAMREGLSSDPAMAPVQPQQDGSHMAEHWSRATGMLRKLAPSLTGEALTHPRVTEAVIAFIACSLGPPVLQAMAQFDMAAALPRIRVPALAIGAALDSQFEHHAAVTSAIPRCASHVFDGVHPLHDLARPERAAEYAEPLIRFVFEHAAP